MFLTKEVDGMVAKLPSATRNMYVDGESSNSFVPDVSSGQNGHGSDWNMWRMLMCQEPRLGRIRYLISILLVYAFHLLSPNVPVCQYSHIRQGPAARSRSGTSNRYTT